MKQLYLVFIPLLLANILQAQVDTNLVNFVAYWSAGSTFQFDVEKLTKQWVEGMLTKEDTVSYRVQFTVLEETDSSYLIEWTYENEFITDLPITKQYSDQIAALSQTRVLYSTTQLGEFLRVENWQEIADQSRKAIESVLDISAKESPNELAAIRESLQPVLQIYSTQAGVEQIVLKELQYFHFPFGVEYDVRDTIRYEELLPNMLGGDPIRGEVELYFESVNTKVSTCTLIQEMTLNQEDTRRYLTELFREMQVPGSDMPALIGQSTFDVRDLNRYHFYYYPGVPIEIECRRESVMDMPGSGGVRLEVVRVVLVE